MRIGVIGAGRTGCAFALGLKEKGFRISGIYSKNHKSVEFLCDKLGENFENDMVQTVRHSDIIFITVPDGEIEHAAAAICSTVNHSDISGKTFLHCSGARASDVLDKIKLLGGHTGSLHPIQTFADKEYGWKGLDGIYYGYEGSTEAQKNIEAIVNAFKGNILYIEKENKPLYHAAACILSNYLVTLAHIAGSLFDKTGIGHDKGLKAFIPLISGALANIGAFGASKALTGPISRGDAETIEKHMGEIREKCPEFSEAYAVLGKLTVEIASKAGNINKECAERLYKILDTV